MASLNPDAGAAGPPALDRAELLALCAGDAGLADELLALFRLHILPEALRLADGADLAERMALAHRLKGAALAIGAREVAMIAGRIEAGGSDEALGPALRRLVAALA